MAPKTRAPRRRARRRDHATSPSVLFQTGVRALPHDAPREEKLDERRRRELGSFADVLARDDDIEFAIDNADQLQKYLTGYSPPLKEEDAEQQMLWCVRVWVRALIRDLVRPALAAERARVRGNSAHVPMPGQSPKQQQETPLSFVPSSSLCLSFRACSTGMNTATKPSSNATNLGSHPL